MRRLLATLLLATTLTINLMAQHPKVPHDSVWVYRSWQSILCQQPDTLIVNPDIVAWTPFDIEITTSHKATDKILKEQAVAVAIGDTTWLINTQWLRENFKGDCKKMDDYTLLFFNAKLAFIQCVPTHTSLGMALLGSLLGDPDTFSSDPWEDPGYLYWIDFDKKRVDKIDHKKLTNLLEIYPDLQRRFAQMRDYKSRPVIRSFFLDFVRRAEQDPGYPYLFDRLYSPEELQ